MGVSMYQMSVLLNTRVLSDLEYKIDITNRRMLALAHSVQAGSTNIFEAFFIEKELMAKRKEYETELESRKHILEAAQKGAKDEAKKSFTIGVA